MMKIDGATFQIMRDRVAAYLTKVDVAHYRAELSRDPRVKDLEKRFRWDIAYEAIGSRWICENIYDKGMHDAHIDTALRRIMRDMGAGA